MLSIDERRQNVLGAIGALVLSMQSVETIMKAALALLPPGEVITQEWLLSEAAAHDRATVGFLCSRLRQRVEIDPDFDEVLAAFLKDRNDLIHDVDRVPGFDISTEDGLRVAERFLANLKENFDVVLKVFLSMLVEWAERNGVGDDPSEMKRIIGDDFQGIASTIFKSKRSPA